MKIQKISRNESCRKIFYPSFFKKVKVYQSPSLDSFNASIPIMYRANIYLFKINNRNTKKGGKYDQN